MSDLILTVVFGFVKCAVGPGYEGILVGCGDRVRGDAYAEGNFDVSFFRFKRDPEEVGANFFRHGERPVLVCVGEYDGELVPAVPGRYVDLAERARQNVAYCRQHPVAGLMPEGVVYGLQVVDVYQEERSA